MRKRQLLAALRQVTNWKIVMKLGRRALNFHGLKDWEFEVRPINHEGKYSRMKYSCGDILGWCSYSRHRIEIDWQLLHLGSETEILDTLHHEIAHALVGATRPSHGRRWRKKARDLGVSEESIERSVGWDRKDAEAKKKTRSRKLKSSLRL